MNGYSKINPRSNTHKSRSIDFSDFFSFPQTPRPIIRKTGKIIRTEEPNQIKKNKAQKSSPERRREEEDDDGGEAVGERQNGERFGVILGRSASVSSSASGFQRAFSMRRSSSVSERYCRIHDQYVALASPIGEDSGGDEIGGRRSVKKKQRGGKILRACKRLLGF